MQPRGEKPILNAKWGSVVCGTLIAVTYGSDGPAIMIDDPKEKTWANISPKGLDMLLRLLGPSPLDESVKVQLTMVGSNDPMVGDPYIESFCIHRSGALTDGGQAE